MSRKVVPFSVADEPAPIIGFFHAVASFHPLPAEGTSADKQPAPEIARAEFQDEVLQLYSDEVINFDHDWRLDAATTSTEGVAPADAGESANGVVHPDIFDEMQEAVDKSEADETPLEAGLDAEAAVEAEAEEAAGPIGHQEGEDEDEDDGRLTLDEQIAFQQAFMNWKNGVDDGGLALIDHATQGGKPSNNRQKGGRNGNNNTTASTTSEPRTKEQQNGAAAGNKRPRGVDFVPNSVQEAKRRQQATAASSTVPLDDSVPLIPALSIATSTNPLTKEALEQVAVSVAAAAASAVVQALGNASKAHASPPDTTAVGARYDELTAWYWAGYHAGRAAALEEK